MWEEDDYPDVDTVTVELVVDKVRVCGVIGTPVAAVAATDWLFIFFQDALLR